MNKTTFVLTDLGIVCSLGIGKQEVSQALFAGVTQKVLTTRKQLFSGKIVNVFLIPTELHNLPVEYIDLNSRNNCLLQLVLDQIIPTVNRLKLKYGSSRIGIILATTSSGTFEAELAFEHKIRTGKWRDHFFYQQQEIASPSIFAAKYLDINGPAYTISTACSSSSKAILSARRLILAGICDAVICGGVDTLCELTLNGFDSLELLTDQICLPCSKNRNGISLGEGAAVFVMTTDEKQSGSIVFYGGGENSDAYHISAPEPNGSGPENAILQALNMAGLDPKDVNYINLHGTGTKLNDEMETKCIYRIFGNSIFCSSTKALTGHTLGAAGAIEAGILWLALAEESKGSIPLPPHIWDEEKDPDLPELNFVKFAQRSYSKKNGYVLISNSFAFGGSNVSVILGKQP
jgi:3-oxoacyl-[acyl-carrier-protein] synthase-1